LTQINGSCYTELRENNKGNNMSRIQKLNALIEKQIKEMNLTEELALKYRHVQLVKILNCAKRFETREENAETLAQALHIVGLKPHETDYSIVKKFLD
jgi:hypothetical protein